eukprot:661732-Pleurochrysis_carterae.AAC.2
MMKQSLVYMYASNAHAQQRETPVCWPLLLHVDLCLSMCHNIAAQTANTTAIQYFSLAAGTGHVCDLGVASGTPVTCRGARHGRLNVRLKESEEIKDTTTHANSGRLKLYTFCPATQWCSALLPWTQTCSARLELYQTHLEHNEHAGTRDSPLVFAWGSQGSFKGQHEVDV